MKQMSKKTKIILTVIIVAGVAIWLWHDDKQHVDYAAANSCQWSYYNGFEVCK